MPDILAPGFFYPPACVHGATLRGDFQAFSSCAGLHAMKFCDIIVLRKRVEVFG